jgi:CheY-like chemotaxis protein
MLDLIRQNTVSLREIGKIPVLDYVGPGSLVFEIIDSGPGVSEEDQKNLFQKFAQVTSNQQKSMLGTGLGLWITKKICEKMNATIDVSSKLGVGTSFSVKINTEVRLKPTTEVLALRKKSSFRRVKAMIVDDSPFNVEIISAYFKTMNINIVHAASNGLDAVEFYEKSLQDNILIPVITMDLEMPVMNGREACQEIRKLEKEYNAPAAMIIVISGNSIETEIKNCLDPRGDIRADHFLRKPIKKYDLENILKPLAKSEPTPMAMDNNNHILVVDDDHFNLQLMNDMLNKAGFKILKAENGQEAVEVYKQHREIKIILMDCEMKIMNGFEATQHILAFSKENKRECPMIYGLTGHSEKEIETKCKDCGMRSMLKKPICFKDLLNTINAI